MALGSCNVLLKYTRPGPGMADWFECVVLICIGPPRVLVSCYVVGAFVICVLREVIIVWLWQGRRGRGLTHGVAVPVPSVVDFASIL